MPTLRVDPLLSYSRRAGQEIRVVLEVVGGPVSAEGTVLHLRGAGRSEHPVTVTAAGADRTRVEASLPEQRFSDGTWRMRLLDPGSGEAQNLQTRLVVRPGRPVALLPGRPPDTVLPEPEPRY